MGNTPALIVRLKIKYYYLKATFLDKIRWPWIRRKALKHPCVTCGKESICILGVVGIQNPFSEYVCQDHFKEFSDQIHRMGDPGQMIIRGVDV